MLKKTVSYPPGSYPDSLCDEEGNQARGGGVVEKTQYLPSLILTGKCDPSNLYTANRKYVLNRWI